MKLKNLFLFITVLISIAFAIVFNNTTSWTLFFILIPVVLLSVLLVSKKVGIHIKEPSISTSENEPVKLEIETQEAINTLALDAHITNKLFSLPLMATSQSNSINHILTFSNSIKRGLYSGSLISVYISDPFGLVKRNVLKRQLETLTIYPARRTHLASLIIKSLTEHIDSKHLFGIESDYSIDSISTYKPYDSIKNIHWKLSSKNDETYVKHYKRFLKSTLNLALHPSFSETFEMCVSLFYTLATQEIYVFKKILVGENSINLPNDLSKFATVQPTQSTQSFPRDTLIISDSYLPSCNHCFQLVVSSNSAKLYSENGLILSNIPLDGGQIYE